MWLQYKNTMHFALLCWMLELRGSHTTTHILSCSTQESLSSAHLHMLTYLHKKVRALSVRTYSCPASPHPQREDSPRADLEGQVKARLTRKTSTRVKPPTGYYAVHAVIHAHAKSLVKKSIVRLELSDSSLLYWMQKQIES